ncbi:hypothetical protein [Rhizobium etli]|uniref:hypothetical protein n=1 Tax=Rhizobium etli TaxID=29449 RepID=UPI0003839CBF|nr:hypothetical protein [Rhizobium etli]AGS25276.1 hypothetical protein REMIM1_PE00186 [Rhizobium etli bv. mimosae str. Mim1]
MERTNSNFNLLDFDVEAFARAYRQGLPLGRQADNAAQSSSFEDRLAELQLGAFNELPAEDGPPPLSGEGGGGIRRSDYGDSMRMPSRFTLGGENPFSGNRHSVDIPGAYLGGATEVPRQSSLRTDPFSSARYTSASEAQPEKQTNVSKNRGLWSRVKSGVRNAFAGSRSARAFHAPEQQEVVSTNARVDYARQPARIQGVFGADEALLEEFRRRATGRMSGGTIRNAQADVRNFSAWLSTNGRAPIAGRLGNPELEPGLERDMEAYARNRDISARRTSAALHKLRDVQAGNVMSTSSYRLAPYSADETLIDMWAAAEKATGRIEPDTVNRQARRLSRLSDWLQRNDRGAMAGRLFTHGLAQDVETYKQQTEDSKIKPDLLRLRRYQQMLDANQAVGLPPPPQEVPLVGREGARQPASLQESASMPATPSEGAWAWFRDHFQDPATPSSVRGSSSDFYGDLEPLVNLDPPTPYESRDDVQYAPAPHPAGELSFVPFSASPEVPDIGPFVGEDWLHGSQPASAVLINLLNDFGLLPNQFGPRRIDINGEGYSVTLGPGGRNDVQLIHHSRLRQRDEAGPSSHFNESRQMDEAGPSGQSVPDLGYLVRGGWQHRERLLPNYLARALEGADLMPAPGRPTYFNIRGVPYRGELVGTGGGARVRIYPGAG